MNQNQRIEDIVPPERRTIRNITNQHSRLKKLAPQRNEDDTMHYENPRSARSSRFGLWFVAGIAVVIFALAFSLLFSGAKVEIVPKQRTVLLNGTFEALKEVSGAGTLMYNVMTIEKTGSKTIAATGKEQVETKASGDLIIYNNFNSSSQRLIKNTRFETSDGLIYRINDSVTVPGKTTKGGEDIPGSVRVTVYADDFGDKYNIGLTDFTIPGFKGSPRFDGFYARSATPMKGGFTGERLVAEADELVKAESEIKENLRQQLLSEAFSQKPEKSLLYEDAIFVEFELVADKEIGDSVEVVERAVLYGVLFDTKDFSRHIAEKTIADFDDSDVEIINLSDLDFAILDKQNSRPWEREQISFTLNGSASIVWLFDEDLLKQDLSGRSKDALSTVLSGYPSVERAEAVLRPFWKSSFPENIQKIKVKQILK
jgi:hypothetical protein